MPVTAGFNPAARNAATSAAQSAQKLSSAQQILSSGQRTVDPSKDPASAAVGATLQGDVLVLEQLIRNTNNAGSVLNYAQSALGNVVNLLNQMKQIATQALDPSLAGQLPNLQLAYSALASQVSSIGTNTAYLGTALLDGTFTGKTFQVGLQSTNTVGVSITTNISTLSSITSDVSTGAAAASANIDADIASVTALVATIGANQAQLSASLDQLNSQLGAESQALDTTTGADVNRTLEDLARYSVQVGIAHSMIQSALDQQKSLGDLVKNASR